MLEKTDEELMELYQNENAAAFEELYRRYSPKVYGYLKKRLRVNPVLEDLYQKVFMRLHEQRHTYKSKYTFAPWVFVITRNILIDWYRSKKEISSEHIDFLVDQLQIEAAGAFNHELDTIEVDLEVLLKDLPENYKEVIRQRYVDGLTFEEMARHLQTNESNVRKMVSRGLEKLRHILGVKHEA